ncbi:hypothetical protein COY16_04995 [Candidatus Roizmanbacteria bacterium CG_4_10_14_0_2_um_filter_39_13]|uniref:Uncharacterized protein n=1 Tax=Candidatus Roizmanbacteria bacterium CG_4_10_14_0_2_um_filter_39_13 TaxID=1974825 RepID=A0A2M7TWL9_9BACT|nr:MAG: hypothetical protein COY16_04995 [Candidatus Roizmanbacteria bacterium CG_4_10_14_0_2_um_filter_39_13]
MLTAHKIDSSKLVIGTIIALLLIWFWFDNSQLNNIEWKGFYYENAELSMNFMEEQQRFDSAPTFSSLQNCMHWGKEYLQNNPQDGFECAYGCRMGENMGLVCKDSTKMITTILYEGTFK